MPPRSFVTIFLKCQFLDPKINPAVSSLTVSKYQVICLSPTMELAKQTGDVAEKMGKFCQDIKIAYAIRGNRRK